MRTTQLAAIFVLLASASHAQTADTILVNGKIVTVDAQSSIREALAIRDGKIVAIGTSAQTSESWRGRSRE